MIRSVTSTLAWQRGIVAIAMLSVPWHASIAVEPPRVIDEKWQIELVESEPDLVTPVGCCFDKAGRLYVVECHTHFPPEDYSGPKEDRILQYRDTHGDGQMNERSIFYTGGQATMAVADLGSGWIAIASRSEVIRVRDANGDGVADEVESLLKLETPATYPHNGLASLAVGPDQRLYVGQGENLGEPYTLRGADGSEQKGGGEGGNVFSCTIDGKDVQRFATGFWNPFGMYFDAAGRLWSVGNDPDAMPPCRLLHVVRYADFGFQFRFGRAGTHPLQSWNGQMPGTLPMAAGTGEAPCAVAAVGNELWVSSWGDNRIERIALDPQGASWTGKLDVLVQGDALFRPVGIAVAPDGSIYISDWVDRSYPVHGQGRLWRMSRKDTTSTTRPNRFAQLSEDEKKGAALAGDASLSVEHRLAALGAPDPFIVQAAATGLIDTKQLQFLKLEELESPSQRLGFLMAHRWQRLTDRESMSESQWLQTLTTLLSDDDESVVLAAVRCSAESGDRTLVPALLKALDRPAISSRLFAVVIASVAYLETGSAARGQRDPAIEKVLIDYLRDLSNSTAGRAIAMRMLPPESAVPKEDELIQWFKSHRDRDFLKESIALLVARARDESQRALAQLAADETLDSESRADAIAGLATVAGEHAQLLQKLALPKQPDAVVRSEASRVLKRSWQREPVRPNRDDLDGWERLVGDGGDSEAGRRVFFRTACANCHAHSGRGAKTGPDLTSLTGMTRRRLLESILQPSKEVGPLYVPYRILTTDGKVLTGLKLDAAGVGNGIRMQGSDGMVFVVPLSDIETQDAVRESIMPVGLEETMSVDELRDLLSFLSTNDARQ